VAVLLSLAACGGNSGTGTVYFVNVLPTANVGGVGSGLALQIFHPQTGTSSICAIPRGYGALCSVGTAGVSYVITVRTQPTHPSQTCNVQNGSGTTPSGPVTGTGNLGYLGVFCTTNPSRFAYVASGSSNSISAYAIDPASGALTALAASPFATTDPVSIAVEPTGAYAFAANGNSAGVSVYSINASNGALTTVSGSPFAAGNGPSAVAIDGADGFAYVANQLDNSVSGYSYNPSNGSLTPVRGSPFAAGHGPLGVSMTFDPSSYASGQSVYVVNGASNTMSAYVADSSQGSMTAVTGSPFPTGGNPASLAVDAYNHFVYVTNQADGTISAFSIDRTATTPGALTAVSGSPFAAGHSPTAIVVDVNARFVYVANTADDTVSGYTIDGSNTSPVGTGGLHAVVGSPFPTGSGPNALIVDNLSKFLYVVNGRANSISVYAIDPTTGALTPINGSPFATAVSPISIALSV
jgi:6-phosphogluconolactonase (cycloisomerase 2 family)